MRIGAARFDFAAGESIRTEYSHKYREGGLRDLAAAAGFATECAWTDVRGSFCVLYLTVGG